MKTGLTLIAVAMVPVAVTCQADDGDKQIERMTVTASRSEKLDTELPLSIAHVSSEVLARDKPQHLSESLQSLSGVLVNQLSGGQGHNAAIRMPINYAGYTLYLQDNIPLQSAGFFNHNALWWSSANSALSRLEVIKGAGTSLYGSGAVAATVNVISPEVGDEAAGEAALMAGEHGYIRGRGSYSSGTHDGQGIRASAAYLHNDGWRQHAEVNKAEVNVLHEWQLGQQQSLKTTLIASDLDQQMNASLTEKQFRQDPTQSGLSAKVEQSDPRRKSRYVRLATEWSYDLGEHYYSLIPYARYRTNDYTATWQNNLPEVESSVTSFGLLALSQFTVFGGSELIAGMDLEHSKGDSYSFQPLTITTEGRGAATYPAGHVFYHDQTTLEAVSPYLQLSGELTEKLSYNLGGRYDHYRYEFDNYLKPYDNDGFGNRSLASRSDSFSHFSPKAALNYLVGQDASIYTRIARAIRIPTAGELYHLKTRDTSAQLEHISEEISNTYELGYKMNLQSLSLEAAVYYMDVDDAIVTAYDDFGASYRVNAASVVHKGIELGAKWQLSEAFELSLAYSRSKHEFDHYIQDQGRVDGKTGLSRAKDLSGNSLPMAPDYVANIRLYYQSQHWQGLNVMAEVQSIGDYWMDNENSRRYEGYTIANLKLNYELNSQLSLHARVSNLTDKQYALQSQLRYGREQIQPGAPRMIYAGLSYQF
ncbi:TonB-dependent receptor [Shewanella corallii]|uniref:TonB-dependent receptor n=1 Tax=Shewanella corallii TaxID=560080 RepID=A0ABT0N9U6_9GAMM|nr:TonB-dependent receptor [Shewanella corallii]MCL2915238.1 TonB-dependent receptor [Shewanella corallii]